MTWSSLFLPFYPMDRMHMQRKLLLQPGQKERAMQESVIIKKLAFTSKKETCIALFGASSYPFLVAIYSS